MKHITVVGSGTMGNGIAHIIALHGIKVSLVDLKQDLLDRALEKIGRNLDRQVKKEIINEARKLETLENIHATTRLTDDIEKTEMVIEAVNEDFSSKTKIFREVDHAAPPSTILASNTSSISITRLASITDRADRVIGMHFMNPVPVMKLVEVIRGYNTSDETTREVVGLAEKLNKTPVEVHDYPGFISNRILMPMINEAIDALFQGVAGVEEIDTVMKLGMAHPMGPLQLADFIGLDVCLSILKVMQEGFGNPKYAPSPLLINMVEAGHLGAKTGEGFYEWMEKGKELRVSNRFKH